MEADQIKASTDPLLQPFQLKGLTIKNRIVSTAHAPSYAEDGMPKERYQLYHEEKARGGIGMTMFGGSSCVGPDSPSVFGQLNVGVDDIIPHFQKFSERVHAHDCRLMCQISHLGRRTTWNVADWLPIVAPSRVREPAHRGFPKAMDVSDIKRVIGYYASAAVRCKEGGLDGIEILQNGHLPGQFLSPDTNKRTDGYGGSLANRARFMLEIYEAVREAVGSDFIVGARVEMDSKLKDGLQADESLESLHMVEAGGCIDFFNMNVGRSDTEYMLANYAVPAMFQKMAPWLQLAGKFKQDLRLPVIHATRISDLATARYAVEAGLLDLVGMTRAHIADPYLVNKMTAGDEHRIRPCVGAGYCIDRIYGEGEALCAHNVATGREKTVAQAIEPSSSPGRKVVVIGGGPAGLEAARVSAERGHNVVLFEANSELGGQVRLAAQASARKDLIGITDWLSSEVDHLGIDVRWNSFADAPDVLAEAPDVVIVATGGLPDTDIVDGAEPCLSTWDVLGGTKLSGKVLFYDDHGQHQAASTIDHMAGDGVDLELVTPDRHACAEMGSSNFPMYLQRFHEKGVTVTPDHRMIRIERAGNQLKAIFENDYGGLEIERTVDHIVVEHGTIPLDDLFQELREGSSNKGDVDYELLLSGQPQPAPPAGSYALFRVGDAVASRNIHAAILDSRRLCQCL